jgi:DNA-binding NarL/FixJ family response regulator
MALIESGRLPAFQILGQWRVEQSMLDQMVDRLYDESAPPLEPTTEPPPSGCADPTSTKPSCAAPMSLTPQQERICRLVGEGMSNAEIADQLCLEISTVKSHLSRMLQRMDLRDRQQLVAHLWRSGFLSPD